MLAGACLPPFRATSRRPGRQGDYLAGCPGSQQDDEEQEGSAVDEIRSDLQDAYESQLGGDSLRCAGGAAPCECYGRIGASDGT